MPIPPWTSYGRWVKASRYLAYVHLIFPGRLFELDTRVSPNPLSNQFCPPNDICRLRQVLQIAVTRSIEGRAHRSRSTSPRPESGQFRPRCPREVLDPSSSSSTRRLPRLSRISSSISGTGGS